MSASNTQTKPQEIIDFNYNRTALWGIGIFAGFLSGFFGIGGGVFMVPALTLLLKYPIKRAIACSLAAIIAFSISGTVLHLLKGAPQIWEIVFFAALGSIPGSRIGVKLRTIAAEKWLRFFFGLLMFFVAYRIFFAQEFGSWEIIPQTQYFWYILVGVFVGMLSGLLGIGGGVLLIPVMMLLGGIKPHVAAATSLATVIAVSLCGTVCQQKLRTYHMPTIRHLIVAGVLATLAGAFLLHYVSPELGKKLFGVLLVLVAIRMLLIRLPKKNCSGNGDASNNEKIDRDMLKETAMLARLDLSEEEIGKFSKELKTVIDKFSKIKDIDTAGVAPTIQPIQADNVLRKDETKQSDLPVDSALNNAPEKTADFFKVPKILGE